MGNHFYWVEIVVLVGLGPPGGSRGESTSLPFWFPGLPYSLACGLSSIFLAIITWHVGF